MLKTHKLSFTKKMKSIEVIKKSIMFLIFVVCASGCYSNERQRAAHKRVLHKDLELLHKDVDSFLGTNEPSMLSE